MPDLDLKLEMWKNKLLDLGKRNRLMNYRDTKRSNLRIITPEIYDLWHSFVVDENPLEFDYYDDDDMTAFDDRESIDKRNVITNQSHKEQQRTLRNLRSKAKTAMEEQGVNLLYLSFGFLKWSDNNHSEQHFLSPLVLVPVSLTVESITAPFILNLHEDEIVLNPTLLYKLENDFGIVLPEYEEDKDLQEYLQSIEEIISRNHKWRIIFDVGLSLLSFLKINMYKDLDIHKDKILSSPIVRALGGDASAFNYPIEYANNFDHDKATIPSDLFQVVDADSSQQDAILLAKLGASFVLQGPPGTGKSQTITNIIAESLAANKKVLFVSEKMAALEVVQNRLAKVGLDAFCLVLHSYKAQKREILDQLADVLDMTRRNVTLSNEAYQKLQLLQEYKERLNEYSDAIYTKIEPLGRSIYDVNGEIAHLQEYEEIIFDLNDVMDITTTQYNHYINLLRRFAENAGRKISDYKDNPWNGANVPFVSNELRHDIGAIINKLLPKISEIIILHSQIEEELRLEHPSSYYGLTDVVDILNTAEKSPKIPISWIMGNDIVPLFDEIEEHKKAKNDYSALYSRLVQLNTEIFNLDTSAKIILQEELPYLSEIADLTSQIEKIISNNQLFATWKTISDWSSISNSFTEARETAEKYNKIKSVITAIFENEIFEIDYKAMQARFKSDYTSLFKIFNRQYKADKKDIQRLHKEIVKKVSDEVIVSTLGMLRNCDGLIQTFVDNENIYATFFGEHYKAEKTNFALIKIQMEVYERLSESLEILAKMNQRCTDIDLHEHELKAHYGFLYNGINTDWDEIRTSLVWAKEFRQKVEHYKVGLEFVERICNDDDAILSCGKFKEQLILCLQNIETEFVWFANLFDNPDEIRNIKMPALTDKLIACHDNLALLEKWIDFRKSREDCRVEGLGDYIDKIDGMQRDVEYIIPMFKKRFFRLWLDKVLPLYPAVMNFRRETHEKLIGDFASLDTLQFKIAQQRIQKKLIDDLPSLDRFTNGNDELSILRRELGKKRKIKPIRKLFREIPDLLTTLKPCLMMSPLSVSLFLEADSYSFDTIIFDEASQVRTENAIGAISRGKQVIIAGDSKQLPPTNFFTASTSDTDYDTNDDEEDDIDAYESILDEAGMLPERTLQWHYRSRHEYLIAFSNAKIYRNNLITFPSNVSKVANNGVEYIYVSEGFYDRGGKKGNKNEAQKVAELVFEHFIKFPERSLGVITFGEVQQQAIDAAIRQMRKENQEFERFFNENASEAFFIKNLENVQGDERDTIIFSIGYAKDANGKMYMNFGPLSKFGGERRLNVAITRAKFNVKLVGSILPTDIDIDRVSADGPKLLRSYIDFAMNGADVLLQEITENEAIEHDSPFEVAVYNFLDRKGYKLGAQVGCSGYRIDMAVKHPSISGRYVLGIECDGAAYHSARTARDRDRLRQSVLEGMGWKIYRIWSTDWIKDPVTEGQKLLAAVENAIKCYFDSDENYRSSKAEEINGDEEKAFLNFSEKEIYPESAVNPYNFGEEKNTSFQGLPRDVNGYLDLGDCIAEVVKNEYPIHYELICRKMAPLFGNEKATIKICREVNYALTTLHVVQRKGDFFYPQSFDKIIPRTVGNTRNIEHISTNELVEAMIVIASSHIGITKESLFMETARTYGFNRTGGKIQSAMQTAYEQLLEREKVREIDGKVIIN